MKLENLPVAYKEPFQPLPGDQLGGHVATEKYCTYHTYSSGAVLLVPVTTLSKHMAAC